MRRRDPTLTSPAASRWVARAMNTCAVVRASPSAWCGRCTGRFRDLASSERPRSPSAGDALHYSTVRGRSHGGGVHDGPAQRRAVSFQCCAQEALFYLRHMGYDDAAAHRLQHPAEHLGQLHRPGELTPSQAVDADGVGSRHLLRADQLVDRIGEAHPASLHGHGGEGDDLVTGGIEPRCLEVDDAEARLPPGGVVSGQLRVAIGLENRGIRSPLAAQGINALRLNSWLNVFCTAATSRNASRR